MFRVLLTHFWNCPGVDVLGARQFSLSHRMQQLRAVTIRETECTELEGKKKAKHLAYTSIRSLRKTIQNADLDAGVPRGNNILKAKTKYQAICSRRTAKVRPKKKNGRTKQPKYATIAGNKCPFPETGFAGGFAV